MLDHKQDGFYQTQEDINLISVELLLIDANVALTFLSIAEAAENKETADRNISNARKAYDSIQTFRTRYVLTDPQTVTLNLNLGQARARLEALGQHFEP